MTDVLGVQITPWGSARDLVTLGTRLKSAFDVVWVQDQMLARNAYTLLGALATSGCGVGTGVTYPIGRNPIEMASAAATAAELVPDDREVIIGMGTGGAVVQSLFRRDKPLAMVAEAIRMMRALWSGADVPLDDYPALGACLEYKPGALARLTYPVAKPPSIVVTGVGPKILSIAGTLADGLISASNMPTHSYAAFASGRFAELSGLSVVRSVRPADAAPLRLIFGINVSISADRERARAFARRQLALVLGNPRLWPDLEAVGLDVESAGEVKRAFDEGLGIDGAAARVSSTLSEALIVSGTPDDCIPRMTELRALAEAEGYREFYVGAPLGPDVVEAADLLLSTIVPKVWPERTGARS